MKTYQLVIDPKFKENGSNVNSITALKMLWSTPQ